MNKYYMANRQFDIEIVNGALASMKNKNGTEFVLAETAFGEAVLTYSKKDDEQVKHWFINKSEGYVDTEPIRSNTNMFYMGEVKSEDSSLTVKEQITLKDDILEQIITIKNISDVDVTIKDAAFLMTPNSEFEWGDDAANKVIAHPFIGGNGSHSLITRCDGKENYLVVCPAIGGKWEFFNTCVGIPKEESTKQKSGLYVFENSSYSAGIACEKGYKPRHTVTEKNLLPNEEYKIGLAYMWADSYESARQCYKSYGIPDIITVPGYTVAKDELVKMCVSGISAEHKLIATNDSTCINKIHNKGKEYVYEIRFSTLGENTIRITYDLDKYIDIDFFVTQDIKTMISKRGAFIASHQVRNEKLWYNGLLTEWNNKTGISLGPDNYDTIKGWRIYEVTCDDPGLSKPAFLSGKEVEQPVEEEVEALDYYIENFVWGGLQCTTSEDYPYGIYGIPDWYQNRNSSETGCKGKEHLWRIYDYPHIMLMYYNMYRVARDYEIKTKLQATEYLERAYRTAIALYTIPLELEQWSAYETGLYNELIIEEIIKALDETNQPVKADRLRRHWERKIKFFVSKSKDLFGSEYPFDTTGFESTHAIAKTALLIAEKKYRDDRFNPPMTYKEAVKFMENQTDCNIACRGYLEPAYYWYGSDYRANNYHYTLSYMSQMGGGALLDYALYYAKNPFEILRLGYGSVLSSWALLNSGDEESNYGYFFPGKEHDGAASGGYEPLPFGKTWLEQPHSSGAWYYSCEIDLGFCGALRSAAIVMADDPVFGMIAYGGDMVEEKDKFLITPRDGIGKRFHIVTQDERLHVTIDKGTISKQIEVSKDYHECIICIDTKKLKKGNKINITIDSTNNKGYSVYFGEILAKDINENGNINVSADITDDIVILHIVKHI